MLPMPRFRYAAADAGDFRHFTPLLRHFRHLPLTAGASEGALYRAAPLHDMPPLRRLKTRRRYI
jgi:hypothetical protein